jgi:hypothetical protein
MSDFGGPGVAVGRESPRDPDCLCIVGAGVVGMWGGDPCGRPRASVSGGDDIRKGPHPTHHHSRPYVDGAASQACLQKTYT